MKIKKVLAILIVLALVASLVPCAFAAEEAASYEYVFSSEAHGLESGAATADRRLTSGLHTVDKTVASVSSPWGFVNAYGYNGLASNSGFVNWTIKDDNDEGVAFAPGADSVPGVRAALAFEISASAGTYDASLSAKMGTSSVELEVYLIPKPADTSSWVYDATDNDTLAASKESFYNNLEAISANYRIGKVDLYGEGKDESRYIGRTTLSGGNYYLILVPCGTNAAAQKDAATDLWTMTLRGFNLNGVSEAVAAEQDISSAVSTAKQSVDTWSYSTHFKTKIEGNVLTAYGACIYSYANTTDRIPMVVMAFQAEKTGKYNLQLKTNSDGISIKKFAAAPLVSYAKYNDAFAEVMAKSDSVEGDTFTDFKKLGGHEIGYFNFSEIEKADTYYDVTKNGKSDADKGELDLEANQNYFLAFSLDETSISLSNWYIDGSSGYPGGPASGQEITVKHTTKPTSPTHAHQAFIISGINLVPVVDEYADAYEADRELYNTLTSVKAENNSVETLSSYAPNATVNIFAQDIATGGSVASIASETVAVNTNYEPSAPAVDDYEFMYWAIGLGVNRKIVSFDEEGYSFNVAPGRNMVYAVYRNKAATEKYAYFFDGGRTVMGKKNISDGSVTLPSLPGAKPGFGNATGWKYTGEEDETALPAGSLVEGLTDDTFFVASYNDAPQIAITIDGETVYFDYGEEVDLGNYASIRENGNGDNVFNYWKKGDEIISFNPDYSFLAYEPCTLKSTYAKYEPSDKTVRRILLSADTETGVTFAEFIGLDSAIEKGILFGDAGATYDNANTKAVMQTNGNVFSVVNGTGKTAIGYAILSNGSIVYSDR